MICHIIYTLGTSTIDPNIEKFAKGQHRGHKNKSLKLLRNHVVFPTFGNFRRLSYKDKIALKRLEWQSEKLMGNVILVVILSFSHCIVGPSSVYGF